jgi:hypothetical protein
MHILLGCNKTVVSGMWDHLFIDESSHVQLTILLLESKTIKYRKLCWENVPGLVTWRDTGNKVARVATTILKNIREKWPLPFGCVTTIA